MYKSGGSYSRRAVETDIIRYVDDVLADPDTSFSVALLIGSRLHGIRALLVRGVVARLRERDPTAPGPVDCRGEWDPVGVIQFCVSEADVPREPPPAGAAVRILLVACFDIFALPAWLSTPDAPHTRTLPVGPLTTVEAHEFLEARLQGPVDPHSAHTLGHLAGYTPQALAVIADECRTSGALALVDGTWLVPGDPVRTAIVPYLRAQMIAAGDSVSRAMYHLAFTEPCSTEGLPAEVLDVATMLLGDGEMRRRDDGRVEFTAPASGEGLRRLAPAALRDRLYSLSMDSGEPSVRAIGWAAAAGRAADPGVLEAAARTALSTGQWRAVADLVDLSGPVPEPGGSRDPRSQHALAAWCRLRLHAATALRFLADPAAAHRRLDEVEAVAASLPSDDRPGTLAEVTAVRADVLHFGQGDPEAALGLIDTRRGADRGTGRGTGSGTGRDDGAPDLTHTEDLAFLHLVHSGAHRQARDSPSGTSGPGLGPEAAPHLPADLHDRIATARTLLLLAAGRPQRALREATSVLAVGGGAVPGPVEGRPRWIEDELAAAREAAALAADGPAVHPLRESHSPGFEHPDPHPDLVRIHHTRAEWHYACGDIRAAHRHGLLALAAARTRDPLGTVHAVRALLAETSALTGAHAEATAAVDHLLRLPPRTASALTGASQAHLASARLLLADAGAGEALRRTAAELADVGSYGFAADILYAGVRSGRRRAAADLCDLSGHLDGTVHPLRVRHAGALLDRDAVELVVVVDLLREAGFHLHAAEAAATAARLPSAPTSARRRATHLVATHLADQPLPGHPLLNAVAGPGAAPLTPREREVTALIDAGLSNAEIADRLTLSLSTVESHITRIYRKTGGSRRAPARR